MRPQIGTVCASHLHLRVIFRDERDLMSKTLGPDTGLCANSHNRHFSLEVHVWPKRHSLRSLSGLLLIPWTGHTGSLV